MRSHFVAGLNFLRARWLELALAGLASLGVAALLHATWGGIGLSPDSASYIAGAIGIAKGVGFSFPAGGGVWQPTTAWPPAYSVALSIPLFIGADPLQTARWLNALLLGATVCLVGALLHSVPRSGKILAILGASLFLLNRDTVSTFGWAWSEGLFAFLGFAGILCLSRNLESGNRATLVVAAVLIGLAATTRFAGLAFIMTGVLAIPLLARHAQSKPARIANAFLFAVVASAPLALWALRNVILSASVAGSGPPADAIPSDEWLGVYRTISLWFMPGRFGEPTRTRLMILLAFLFGGAAAIVLRGMRLRTAEGGRGPSRLGVLALTFLLSYSLVLLASRTLFRSYPLDEPRILLPLFPGAIVLFSIAGTSVWSTLSSVSAQSETHGHRSPLLWIAALATAVYVLILMVSFARHTAAWIQDSREKGLGYSSDSWRTSRLLQALAAVPQETPIYSNSYDAIFLLTGRQTYPLPADPEAGFALPPRDLPEDWRSMVDHLLHQEAIIVYFNEPSRMGMVDEARLLGTVSLCPTLRAKEGSLYQLCDESVPRNSP